MAKIIDGKLISLKVKDEIKEEIVKNNLNVGLALVRVGNDQASKVYVKNKIAGCEYCGIHSYVYEIESGYTNDNVIRLINQLNNDNNIHGILVQLPLPAELDQELILNSINPNKDVDGFLPYNLGNLVNNTNNTIACTPKGIIRLLKESNVDISGKNAVVIGRSIIVGKPIALLLLQENATVTICHSKTSNIDYYLKNADIIVAAVGKAKFLKSSSIKDGAVIIDVGINRDENGKLCGDVDFDNVKDKASLITPVPGGVGPMTIAMLLENTLELAKKYGI
ncbi:MAG: bifunctional methylenetetrahydrofolate dehydrogenase/methenyltetrahydrofolate cyclohydrolase FolD [Clostridia bacterium]|nr:bifunctional methylenetetrahydrofolate dehydrogenase/methenyltetrahydrofolate cyclohydrolase FolD [Clostridia bacterium]